jgi:hypothetical protein
MRRLLDDIMADPLVAACLHRLQQARTANSKPTATLPT